MTPKTYLADCDHCPLKARPFCPSQIPHNATLTVVGEAPGTAEIIECVPFVGQSGIVLQHALAYAGIDFDQVAKTNAVLCRPFNSEAVPDQAIIACAARLDHDIITAGAKHIVAMGNSAVQALDRLSGRNVSMGILSRAGMTYDYQRSIVNDGFNTVVADDDPVSIKNAVFKYTATVNPAFVLRTDPYMPNFIRHIQLAINPRERDFNIDAVKYVVMNDQNWSNIVKYMLSFDPDAPCAFDVETANLQWFDTPARSAAELLCLVFTFEDLKSIIIPEAMLALHAVYQCVESTLDRCNIIAHNGKFDQHVMRMRMHMNFNIDDDTMLMHYALYELGSHGLKTLATEYLGAPDYEEMLITSWFRDNGMALEANRDYSKLPTERLYKYAAIDGAVTWQLYHLFKAELAAKQLYAMPYKDQPLMPLANALTKVEQTGIGVDREQLARADVEFHAVLIQLEASMTDMIMPLIAHVDGKLKDLMTTKTKVYAGDPNGKGGIKRGTARYETTVTYNPRSNAQTSAILYDVLNLKLQKRLIKPTSTNTGKEALEALPDHPFVDLLRQHRRIAKMVDTYIASIMRRATVDDLIHVDFRITGTEIGRLSASGGDHGIPRPDDYYGAVIRSLFIADPHNEDEVLIVADYSQAELRAFAHLSQCAFLIEKYKNGEDVHKETALMLEKHGAQVFHGFAYALRVISGEHTASAEQIAAMKAFVKARRVLAKNTNFGGLLYQGGAAGISGMIGGAISIAVLKEVLPVLHAVMPEAKAYAEQQYAYLCKHGYVKTIFNRHRRFYVISDMNKDEARKAAVHMVVAGSAADLTNLSLVRLINQGIRICHSNHDSLIARCMRSEAPTVAALIQSTMQAVGAEFMPSVPWVVDLETSRRWSSIPDRKHYDERGKLIT